MEVLNTETQELICEQKDQTIEEYFENVIKYKKRMLEWDNPVEYVNNMYGSHPDNDPHDKYFDVIFSNEP